MLNDEIAAELHLPNGGRIKTTTRKIGKAAAKLNAGLLTDALDASEIEANTRKQLAEFVARLDRLDERRKDTAADVAQVWAEIKAAGYDAPALKQVLRDRDRDQDERNRHSLTVATYETALRLQEILPGLE